MRQGQQNRRGRGRSNNTNSNTTHTHTHSHNHTNGRKPQNPLSRNYESSGPDVKIRGTAAQVAEKYMTLARDAHSAGDPVLAENYLQHAEHYNRIIMAAQAQAVPQHQPLAGEHGPGMNGQHRTQNEQQFGMRDQPQPVVEQPSLLPPGMEPQPQIMEQPAPVAEAAPVESEEAGVAQEPAAPRDGDGTRRRRRRYPAGGAAARANGGSEPGGGHNGSGNGLDAATENRPPDEVLAS